MFGTFISAGVFPSGTRALFSEKSETPVFSKEGSPLIPGMGPTVRRKQSLYPCRRNLFPERLSKHVVFVQHWRHLAGTFLRVWVPKTHRLNIWPSR